ncbi:MAG: glycosyltransferase [Planctomycetota bacterium]|nr:glycosyltransferase [Planctomycetota bacterium]
MDRRIRVGLLINELGIGGAEKALEALALGLQGDSFEVEVGCLDGTEPGGARLRERGVSITDFQMHWRFDLRGILRCRAWLRDRQLDIVHAFLSRSQIVSRLAVGRSKGPVLIHSQRNSGIETAIEKMFRRATHDSVRRFTAVSYAVKAYLVKEVRIPGKKIDVIRNGIDLDEFDRLVGRDGIDRAALDIPPTAPLVGTIGHMRRDRSKGYPALVETARLLRDRTSARLLVCGDGGERPEVERLVKSSAVEDRFLLLGLCRDIPTFLSSVDIYVQASIREGFPNAILEAMAARLPVVATSVGGIPEIVQDGVTGILVPSDRPAEMAEAILSLLADAKSSKAMGEAGRASVEQDFTLPSMIDAHARLYRELIS